ncbi:MAG: glycosyltransferase family 39 protein [Gemmataceae bacterium]|nr:glycosyltransferase family 39 protein [Gemmataceae bacterium]
MRSPGLEPTPSATPWRVLACLLVVGSAALRVFYLSCACPLDLSPDEAHYWDWSRHLDWSYYSKGPLVAYLIRLGCALAGTEMLAVRLPAVVCGALLLAGLYVLTVQVTRREGLALAVVVFALTLPPVAAGSTLMTIDAPYTCCWCWALVLAHRAVFGCSGWAWLLGGLVVGLGILAKYTMVLFVPSLGLFLLTSQTHRRLLARPGFWVLAGVAALCCLPIFLWNAQNGWVSLLHVGGQAGLTERHLGLNWSGPVVFVGVQFCLLLGFWFVVWVRAMVAHAPWRESRPQWCYLWWMSAPMFVVFLLFALKNGGGEPNWPLTAYLSGLVLAVSWLASEYARARGSYRGVVIGSTALACGLGLGLIVLMHDSAWAHPLMERLAGPPAPERPIPLRRLDPTCRLRGWRELAEEVDRVCAELRQQGSEPVLAGSGWSLPGALGFYCQGQPTVYSLGLALGERRSQYDLWRPNPVWDSEQFRGRTFVFVGQGAEALRQAFDEVGPPRMVTHTVNGRAVARWTVTVCRGYRGFGPVTSLQTGRAY